MTVRILRGDCLDVLRAMPADSVHCVVTSPPYYGLRDYGTASWSGGDPACGHTRPGGYLSSTLGASTGGRSEETHARSVGAQATPYRSTCGKCGAIRTDSQIGLEATPDEFVATLVEVFRLVRRALRDDGTVWLNLGDSYAGNSGGEQGATGDRASRTFTGTMAGMRSGAGLKPKDLMMMPARVALALQADGWWLRSDIIWHKPNPMPESVTDRPTSAHEHVFLLAKQPRYFYDADAVREAHTAPERQGQTNTGWCARHAGDVDDVAPYRKEHVLQYNQAGRNARSVWTIATHSFSGAHLLADYVGRDGKPYKRLEDCPVHGLPSLHQNRRTGAGDAQPNHPLHGNPGNDVDPDARREDALAAIPWSSSCRSSSESPLSREQGNMGENRMPDPLMTLGEGEPNGAGQSPSDTDGTVELSTQQDHSLDCLPLGCSSPANLHSSEIRRTGRAPGTSLSCNTSVETAQSTHDRLALPGLSGSVERMPVNNTSQGDLVGHLSVGTHKSSARISSRNGNRPICTCEVVSVDHFATFPPELAERCIKAGTSERGCCAACGAPWVRQVERGALVMRTANDGAGYVLPKTQQGDEFSKNRPDTGIVPNARYETTTTGWSPSCTCAAACVPAVVLDPFGGAGTVGLVADRLQRDAVMIELNPDYAAMAERRLHRDAGMFAMVATA